MHGVLGIIQFQNTRTSQLNLHFRTDTPQYRLTRHEKPLNERYRKYL